MLTLIPLIHARQCRFTALNGEHRTFGDQIEVGIGHQRGDFNDHVVIGIEPGHFQIDPD